MRFNFFKKIFIISIILITQSIFLYLFYINEGLIFNFKTPYLTNIYLPSYIYLIKDFKFKINDYLASMISGFNRNDNSDKTIFVNNQNVYYAKSIPVLLYHGVIENPDGSNMLLEDFKNQMFALKKAGWQTVSIEDFYKFMKGEKDIPDKSFLLTFDDGRKDSYYPVDPILKALNYNAVIFVITKYSLEDKSGNYYLSKKELKRMVESGRWEIQPHTRDGHNIYKIAQNGELGHFYSNKLWLDSENHLETEEEFTGRIKSDFAVAKNDIEQKLGTKVISFAFPFGDFGQNTINFSQAEPIILNIAKSIYLMAFYQVWLGQGFSFNYPEENPFLIKRIEVRPYWNSDNLLKVLNTAKNKNLPYFDNFNNYNGWIKSYGKLSIEDNEMILDSYSIMGSSVFLDGSYLWENYIFKNKVELLNGQTFSLLARYKDDSNYVSCVFTPESLRIEQVTDNERRLVQEKKGNFVFTRRIREVGISVRDNNVDCYIDNEIAMKSYNIANLPPNGGIGFGAWDTAINNSKMIINKVSVEEIK